LYTFDRRYPGFRWQGNGRSSISLQLAQEMQSPHFSCSNVDTGIKEFFCPNPDSGGKPA
jgi:hypothetical protein